MPIIKVMYTHIYIYKVIKIRSLNFKNGMYHWLYKGGGLYKDTSKVINVLYVGRRSEADLHFQVIELRGRHWSGEFSIYLSVQTKWKFDQHTFVNGWGELFSSII